MTKEKLEKFILDKVSNAEKQEILHWLYASPTNMEYYLELRKVWDASLLNLDIKSNNSDLEDSYEIVLQKAGKHKLEKPNKSIIREIWRFGQIASVLLLLALSLYVILDKYQAEPPLITYTTIKAPFDSKTHILLPDGTSVWLNSNSELTYPNTFGNEERVVTLNGEARFDVTKSKHVPFVVNTDIHNIKVLGTNFNVFAYKTSNMFETTLVEGLVHIENKLEKGSIQEMKPGETLMYDKKDNTTIVKMNSHPSILWTEGVFAFDDMPISEILDKVSHYKGVEIVYENTSIKNVKYTGKFRETATIGQILNVMKTDKVLKYRIENNLIYIQ